jgi:hypothetical protein
MPFCSILPGEFYLSEGKLVERQAFPRYKSWKIMTFQGLFTESFLFLMNISAIAIQNSKIILGVHQGPERC